MPARTVARGLDVQAVVHAVDQNLRLSLGLHVGSHHAEQHPGTPAPAGKPGNDGLKRTLARLICIGMSVDQRKKLAAALKHESETVGDQPRPEPAIVGLNHRHHQAVGVGHREVGGVAEIRSPIEHRGHPHPIRPNELCALGGVGLRIEPVDRDVREMRIRVMAGAILVSQALGLGLRMDRVGGLETHSAQIEILENVEHLKRCESLRIGPHRIDVHATVSGDQRFNPFACVRAKILARQPAADAPEVGVDDARDRALMERVAAALGNRAIGAREVRISKRCLPRSARALPGHRCAWRWPTPRHPSPDRGTPPDPASSGRR